jgi:anti-anti-sigma factor
VILLTDSIYIIRNCRDDCHEVIVQGDIKFGNWERMVGEVYRAFEDGAKIVLLDWSNVSYFDSSALQGLVSIHRRIKDDPKRTVCLITPHADHLRILTVTSFDKLFMIFSCIKEANLEISGARKPV